MREDLLVPSQLIEHVLHAPLPHEAPFAFVQMMEQTVAAISTTVRTSPGGHDVQVKSLQARILGRDRLPFNKILAFIHIVRERKRIDLLEQRPDRIPRQPPVFPNPEVLNIGYRLMGGHPLRQFQQGLFPLSQAEHVRDLNTLVRGHRGMGSSPYDGGSHIFMDATSDLARHGKE